MNIFINFFVDVIVFIKLKEELVVQYGLRRFVIKFLFFQGGVIFNDVYKYCWYIYFGQLVVVIFMGFVVWGFMLVFFYKRIVFGEEIFYDDDELDLLLKLVVMGIIMFLFIFCVIVKRVIFIGYLYYIYKKIVIVWYMFFNREDVEWFKVLFMWIRRGCIGFIKEFFGIYGYFKVMFDGWINFQDLVGVSLYKWVWFCFVELLRGLLFDFEQVFDLVEDDVMDVDVEQVVRYIFF